MYQTLINVQNGKAVPLQQYIENRNGDLRVGLRSITYTVGWYNIDDGQTISWRTPPDGVETDFPIPAGLYNTKQLTELIEASGASATLTVSKVNGLVNLVVPTDREIKCSNVILRLLGFDDGYDGQWLDAGTYNGDRPVNFALTKTLQIHLKQLNTSYNILDGAPSTLLAVVGVSDQAFGETVSLNIPSPVFQHLSSGNINELEVSIYDDIGRALSNHDLPISIVLEICEK